MQSGTGRVPDTATASPLELRSGDESFVCVLTFVNDEPSDEESAAAFRNEVLDQVLRERIREETAAARNLILALAFSQTGTVDS